MTRETQPLSMRIGAWLRRRILDVRMPPGAPIVEADIAQRFGTSRTPVREALLRLADEGLVDILPQRGTYVARLALPRIAEALFVRQAVECAVLERVVPRADRAALAARLAAVVDAHEAALDAGDVAGGFAADAQFHRELVAASGLPGVWDVVARAREMHQRIRAIAVPELGSARTAIAEHRAIVRALRAGRVDAARAAMARHVARNLALAEELARRHPDYFAPPDRSDLAA
ncbi:MAG TPA: GntR family transcriptional regulator [Casimicrobiaceae bacterium]|nr:GntR family transcriptional regulator [Casimicrobiaceae bacterium]